LILEHRFTDAELTHAFGLRPHDISNWRKPRFAYLPPRRGEHADITQAARVYALARLVDAGLAGPSAASAAEAVAPLMVEWLKGTRPKLVFVDGSGNVVPAPKQLDKLPVAGPIGIVVDLEYATRFVAERLEAIVEKRKWIGSRT
jgi:hypothetical protein